MAQERDAPTGDGTLWPAARAADSPLPVLTGCLGACASSLRRHFVARNMLRAGGGNARSEAKSGFGSTLLPRTTPVNSVPRAEAVRRIRAALAEI